MWRGGVTILMRAILAAYDIDDRRVWVADSFQGLPSPDGEHYPADADIDWSDVGVLKVGADAVRANFERYGLWDDQVRILEGWFCDTLPDAPIERLAVLRLDGDLYQSTIDALDALEPRVSPGGFVIVDDYGGWEPCRGGGRRLPARPRHRRPHRDGRLDRRLVARDAVAVERASPVGPRNAGVPWTANPWHTTTTTTLRPPVAPASRHQRALAASFVLVVAFLGVQVGVGVATGSLALLSDAGHMATDAIGLAVALLAIRIATHREPTRQQTFGLYRLEILAALLNSILLFGVAGYVLFEAIDRLRHPEHVASVPVLVVGVIGLLVNVVSLRLLRQGASESLNVEGAYLEVMADMLGSIGVIVGADGPVDHRLDVGRPRRRHRDRRVRPSAGVAPGTRGAPRDHPGRPRRHRPGRGRRRSSAPSTAWSESTTSTCGR